MQKIIIIEDDDSVRLNLETFLEDEGFGVRSFRNAEEAINSLSDFNPEVAIVDIRLPGMDGNEFMQKAATTLPTLKMIIHTGDLSYKIPDMIKHLNISSEQILFKPLDDLQTLTRVIHALN